MFWRYHAERTDHQILDHQTTTKQDTDHFKLFCDPLHNIKTNTTKVLKERESIHFFSALNVFPLKDFLRRKKVICPLDKSFPKEQGEMLRTRFDYIENIDQLVVGVVECKSNLYHAPLKGIE